MPHRRNGALPKIRVLQVEDSALDAELMLDELAADGIVYEARLVDNEADYLAALDAFEPHIILSDLSMPGFSGRRALELLRARDSDTPFIFVSAALGEEAAVQALRDGATDYILKQNPARLASAVRRALAEVAAERARRHAEAELMRAQRFESLALLAGGLSHDLRNLLQPLLLAGESLQDYKDDPRLARLGALVRDCGRRGLQMVQSMLSFARGAQRAERIKLGALLEALQLLLQGSVPSTVDMQIHAVDAELIFEGNQTELQQSLLNLCLNALQAMPEGGRLTIDSAIVDLDADFFAVDEDAHPGRYLRITVADTGVGMDQATLDRLFEPFFTTKPDGTGLGLLSCKRIIDNHHGVMRAESQPGQGTRFHLYLPLEQPVEGAIEGESGTENLYGNAERVLVVVEEGALLSLLIDALDSYGYQPAGSQSGASALQWIEANGLPELVILDADMYLLTGVRTLAALIERGYRGAVLLLARPEATPDPAELPPLEHLYLIDKPVSARALLRDVRRALTETRTRP
ncbi:MAG: response regulator [Fulvimonas sp.]|nr:response regulator [Fulvimonas sp.]